MERHASLPRPDWPTRCESVGFSFHSADGGYWDESACYRFTADQIDRLEAVTEELHALCLHAVDHVITARRYAELGIPPAFEKYIADSWTRRDPSLFGRFDLSWDGVGAPRMLEYNADTPTSLLEAAIVQWYWLQDVRPASDQFNALHERLVARWQEIAPTLGGDIHFACLGNNEEDLVNTTYLMDTAMQAGANVRHVAVERIGYAESTRCFVDDDRRVLRSLFKLYPWEWLFREDFGPMLPRASLRLVEPPWKAILSNKAILCILWELFPGHPNLLPAYRTSDRLGPVYVKKPLLSREGANVTLHTTGGTVSSGGAYGAEGYVYQAYAPLPTFDGRHPVLGTWIVGDKACGLGIREDAGPITGNLSRFVPHYFE